ncbi:MAG: CofH family radical SAM protein [Euryarchaeota archaeon]|nr:CofH family radical SAM protein [Euryarchaeota archaeon]
MRFLELATDPALVEIGQKVVAGERLSFEDGVALMSTRDVLTVGALADWKRRQVVGDDVYFTNNINMNPTNICVARCKLCAFGVPFGTEGTFTLTHDQVREKARYAAAHGIQECHVVGGLNPLLKLDYFTTFLDIIREEHPQAYVQGFTSVEIDYIAQREKTDTITILKELRAAGLHALPGGGAEVLNDRIHKEMCDHKTGWRDWLRIHEEAHGLGMKTNATMLYGHMETAEERVDHMLKLRDLQDRTGGFKAFIGLAFHPKNTAYEGVLKGPTGHDSLLVHAVGRLMIDNFPHIKMLWTYHGKKLTSVALSWGVDDVGGSNYDELIIHAAGNKTVRGLPKDELVEIIEKAGRNPVLTNSGYWGTRWEPERSLARPRAEGPAAAVR